MSQLDLLAPPVEPIAVDPTDPAVLIRGASTIPHRFVPPLAPKVDEEAAWAAMLDLAEDACRHNQPGKPILDTTESPGSRSNGTGRTSPAGHLSADSRGIRHVGSEQSATWPNLLAGLRRRREAEPEVARARDLAEGYRLLRYYGSVYGEGPWSEGWTPRRLIRAIAADVITLGGDPTVVEVVGDEATAGVAEAVGEAVVAA